ncbi:MAG: hypothetical protein JST40_12315 [Armatimonadetes bacterium]|nr:hypothetical protein [Armatimonadota bacterium]
MFRRIYWTVEEISTSGESMVTGIYTSIFDLYDRGFRRLNNPSNSLRLSLIKLDCAGKPLGCWTADQAKQMETDLRAYVESGEFDPNGVKELVAHFEATAKVPSA